MPLCNAATRLVELTYPQLFQAQYTSFKYIAVHKTFCPQGSRIAGWLPPRSERSNNMKAPKILPWIARKAGISDELALKLWRRAISEAEYLAGKAEGAKEVMDTFKAPMTKDEYLTFMRRNGRDETFDGLLCAAKSALCWVRRRRETSHRSQPTRPHDDSAAGIVCRQTARRSKELSADLTTLRLSAPGQ